MDKILEQKAKVFYQKFLESVETSYMTQKIGFDEQTDELIIQGSLQDAIDMIANACVTLQDERGKLRTAYFKIAILFLETLHVWKYAYMMAVIAMRKPEYKKYFAKAAKEHKGKENKQDAVYFDIDELFNKFDVLLMGIE